MRTFEQNEKIIAVLEKYSLTCECDDKDVVLLRDRKGRVIGTIGLDGTVEQKFSGRQNLMGTLVRNELRAAVDPRGS